MTDDRALLEAAAKAAGHRITWGEKYYVGPDEVDCTDLAYIVSDSPDESPAYWNPLEDDGDALRLGVQLHMHIQVDDDELGRVFVFCSSSDSPFEEESGPDPAAATRRAIVRAAAAMAKT